MKIRIVCPRLKILVEALENGGEKHLRLGRIYYRIGGPLNEVVLVEDGIGKVMSAMSVAVLAMFLRWKPLSATGSGAVHREGISSCGQIGPIMMWMATAFGYKYGQKWQVNHFTLNPVASFDIRNEKSSGRGCLTCSRLDYNRRLIASEEKSQLNSGIPRSLGS